MSGPLLLIGLLLVGAVLLGWLLLQESTPFRGTTATSLARGAALDRIAAVYAAAGWRTTSRTDTSVTFARREGPNLGIALLLAFFGILPALVYLLIAGRDLTAMACTEPRADGMTDVEIVGNAKGFGSQRTAARALRHVA